MRKKVWLFALAAVLLVILAGCRGNELPDGMDEDKVSSAGLAVMSQLTKGEYEEVYDALREDVREQTSADAIEEMMDTATEGRGSFKKVKDSMVTGVTDADEPHAIAVIGAADGPTAIFVANVLHSQYLGAIMVAAYSYMALVPIVQPPVIKLLTTQKERRIRMPYQKGSVSQLTKILFPIVVTIIAGLVAPASVALVGFLMFGNLLRECGVLNTLSETAQNVLANLITIVLGLTVAGQMTADKFVRPDTLLILALGLVAFVFDTAGGVLFAKLVNLFLPEGKKLNPMIGAAGISAFPMSGRVVNKLGLEEDNQNFLLMYSISVNVSGQIASVIAGGLLLTLLS